MIDLIKGDCLIEMQNIADSSIDCIICDLPYGTTACKWDSIIDFDLMWVQLNRIIKTNSAIVLFGSEPFSSALRMSNIKNYKYDWIWLKNTTTGGIHAKNKPLKKHEIISIFSLGVTIHKGQSLKRMNYFPQGLSKLAKPRFRKSIGSDVTMQKRKSHKPTIQTIGNYPNSVIEFNTTRGFHPTQKPIELMEYLIKTYTQENETVLDFTMGSGSTGVACKNTNRNFIGIEKDDNYFKIAQERINCTELNPNQFEKLEAGGQKLKTTITHNYLLNAKKQCTIPFVINCPICGSSTTMADPNKCMTPDCPNCIK